MSASGATVMARGVDRGATGVRSGGWACREFDVRSRDGEKWPRLAFEKHQCSRWYWRGVDLFPEVSRRGLATRIGWGSSPRRVRCPLRTGGVLDIERIARVGT